MCPVVEPGVVDVDGRPEVVGAVDSSEYITRWEADELEPPPEPDAV